MEDLKRKANWLKSFESKQRGGFIPPTIITDLMKYLKQSGNGRSRQGVGRRQKGGSRKGTSRRLTGGRRQRGGRKSIKRQRGRGIIPIRKRK